MSKYDESGFDRSYKIPKRKLEEAKNAATDPFQYNYNNYCEEEPWQRAMYSQLPQYPEVNPVEPLTQKICRTLSHIKERPKNFQKNIFRETAPDIYDTSLPKELTAMFQPLFCKLCTAQLTSNVMAKLHYKSKNHEKRIRKYLVEYSERTGEPLHKRAKTSGTKTPKTEMELNPTWFHCDVCDLELTGQMHAESHYMGKNHQRVLMGHKAPSGRGYYNKEGKWVRQGPKTKTADGTDTFGLAFRAADPEPTVVPQPPPPPKLSNSTITSKFQCSICNINTTSLEQIKMHYKGQKHQKKVKQLGGIPISPFAAEDMANPAPPPSDPVKVIDNVNLSVYRTPSGDFYCPTCNLTLNVELQFRLHLRSKGHLKKSLQQKQ